uniref:Uncharacterized protein n=1 Tax=Chromera velia CCMP2878 TaxID=1169474 RepID=A0A0G4H637_9ALVE|eukprot:Cvel_24842.t1-p1 / transcript=Cvel_24842.t1 / gene=Cvel_24842 / organism=Chromera_velia_CCMP2878 / gene_product=hypothetical protein / transcript_product=hypothetical protein / location=Cvel_scaffold2740:22455-23858(-) / protein_length=284 / sequence_SO=supercontig / SO=protein_coding / is_pseudo=false
MDADTEAVLSLEFMREEPQDACSLKALEAVLIQGRRLRSWVQSEGEQRRKRRLRENEERKETVRALSKSVPVDRGAEAFTDAMWKRCEKIREMFANTEEDGPGSGSPGDFEGICEFEGMCEEFNRLLGQLETQGQSVGVTRPVPWQISQCAAADPLRRDATVDLEGGKITNRFGQNIWGAECGCCGVEIQNGAHGEGTDRWHCLDCALDTCMECEALLRSVEAEGVLTAEELRQFDPHWDHLRVVEQTVPVFLRLQTQLSTASEALQAAFSVYGPRPCLGCRRK